MGVFTGIVAFVLIWWMVVVVVLPWGNAPPDAPEPGHAPSAPARPRLGLKMLITTGISVVIWIGVFLFVEADVFSFQLWSRTLQ